MNHNLLMEFYFYLFNLKILRLHCTVCDIGCEFDIHEQIFYFKVNWNMFGSSTFYWPILVVVREKHMVFIAMDLAYWYMAYLYIYA